MLINNMKNYIKFKMLHKTSSVQNFTDKKVPLQHKFCSLVETSEPTSKPTLSQINFSRKVTTLRYSK